MKKPVQKAFHQLAAARKKMLAAVQKAYPIGSEVHARIGPRPIAYRVRTHGDCGDLTRPDFLIVEDAKTGHGYRITVEDIED